MIITDWLLIIYRRGIIKTSLIRRRKLYEFLGFSIARYIIKDPWGNIEATIQCFS